MELFFARQPIFDSGDRVLGYELLYRADRDADAAGGASAHRMTCQVLVASVLDLGLAEVTGGKPAFLNVGREMLLDGHLRLLPAAAAVFEIPAWLAEDEECAAACRALAAEGRRLALDGFDARGGGGALLEACEFVKIDVSSGVPERLPTLPGAPDRPPPKAIAVRVETREERARCLRAGFEGFQGSFYRAPELLASRPLPLEGATLLEIQRLAGETDASQRLEEAVRSSPALAWRLVRLAVDEAGAADVSSLGEAIRLVGPERLRRWLGVLAVTVAAGRGGMADELASAALARARFLELVATRAGVEAEAAFLTGLFSLMDAILGLPLAEVLAAVDLEPRVREALLHGGGPAGAALRLVRAFEAGDWEEVARHASEIPFPEAELPEAYRESLVWARDRLGGRTP